MDYEQLLIANELGEIIRLHNQAVERLKSYREARPYLLAPNIASMLEGNLKDNIEVLYRQLNDLHKPKTQQRRYVCQECHHVFLTSLSGGLCDECRSRRGGGGRYGGVVPTPAPNEEDAAPGSSDSSGNLAAAADSLSEASDSA